MSKGSIIPPPTDLPSTVEALIGNNRNYWHDGKKWHATYHNTRKIVYYGWLAHDWLDDLNSELSNN
jgi:hypothetical protein